MPKKKLSVPNGHGCRSGLNAKNVPSATTATDQQIPDRHRHVCTVGVVKITAISSLVPTRSPPRQHDGFDPRRRRATHRRARLHQSGAVSGRSTARASRDWRISGPRAAAGRGPAAWLMLYFCNRGRSNQRPRCASSCWLSIPAGGSATGPATARRGKAVAATRLAKCERVRASGAADLRQCGRDPSVDCPRRLVRSRTRRCAAWSGKPRRCASFARCATRSRTGSSHGTARCKRGH